MIYIGVALCCVAASIHLWGSKKDKNFPYVFAVVLQYVFLFIVGLSGVMGFLGHVFNSDEIAQKIGWPVGNPFQFEVAVANLAFGIMGILSFWKREDFQLATALGYAVFLIGAGIIHLRQMFVVGNHAELNSGVMILTADFVLPLVILALVLLQKRFKKV